MMSIRLLELSKRMTEAAKEDGDSNSFSMATKSSRWTHKSVEGKEKVAPYLKELETTRRWNLVSSSKEDSEASLLVRRLLL